MGWVIVHSARMHMHEYTAMFDVRFCEVAEVTVVERYYYYYYYYYYYWGVG